MKNGNKNPDDLWSYHRDSNLEHIFGNLSGKPLFQEFSQNFLKIFSEFSQNFLRQSL
jgi:hypothetical protein